jgi:hypothetical protein
MKHRKLGNSGNRKSRGAYKTGDTELTKRERDVFRSKIKGRKDRKIKTEGTKETEEQEGQR